MRTGADEVQREDNPETTGLNRRLNKGELHPELNPRNERGEFCQVERVFKETGKFNFTSGERIESADDVAFIFSALEDAAKEHAFMVLVKNGKPTVVELGMGTFTATLVDTPTASLAYSRIKPDEVYFVHNHPSGNLKCSPQDVQILEKMELMAGQPVQGVIINLKTGKYGIFGTKGERGEGQKRIPEKAEPLTVHTLDKQIFADDYDPMAAPLVRSSRDVASFLNSQRMGDRAKVSFLILSRANRVIGNIHTPFTDITKKLDDVARYISEKVIQFGGESAILYGDFAIDSAKRPLYKMLQDAVKSVGSNLLDIVHVEGNRTRSANDEGLLYEPGADYGNGDTDLRFREVEDDKVLTEFAEGKTVKAYRTMQVINGKLYSPMATKVGGKATPEIKLGKPEQSEEHPEIIKGTKTSREGAEYGYVVIDKGLGKGRLQVAYNPYIHASRTVLNDQFTSAHIRPNLVVVEVEIPESELMSEYRADKAKNSVGEIAWHSGTVSGQLAELGQPRRVILSRYDRPLRILTAREQAKMIAEQLDGTEISLNYNLVTPQVRIELERLGVNISEEASGSVGSEADYGKAEYITDQEIGRINARQTEMRQRSEEAKRSRAEGMSKRMGTPIRIVTDASELTHSNPKMQEAMRKNKGWYDLRTGEVVVVLPNNADVEDVAETVLHEVVAHKGLRELIGEDNYDTFCDEVYNHLKDELKQEVDEEATRRFMDEPEQGYEHARRKSVDEMFGRMSEKGFEDFTKAERGIWAKLKERVLAAINKFLGSLKLPKWVRLGDNELRYMLWRSHERLRGKDGYVDMARDAAKREELGLNDRGLLREDKEEAELRRVNGRFNEQLERLTPENADKVIFNLGDPTTILLAGGVESKPLKLYGNKVIKKMKKHGFALSDLRDLPAAIAHPIAIFNNIDRKGNRSILTELTTSQGNILVSVDLGKGGDDIDFNIISSVFGKGKEKIVTWIEKGYATYINKSKALDYLHHSAPIAEALSNPRLKDAAKVVKEFENPIIDKGILFREGETGDIWKDRSVGLEERITNAAVRLANNQRGDLTPDFVTFFNNTRNFLIIRIDYFRLGDALRIVKNRIAYLPTNRSSNIQFS